MRKPVARRPSVFEVCPASTLRQLGPALPYKGRAREDLEARRQILQALQAGAVVPERLAQMALDDNDGDAIDSIIAAVAIARALAGVTDRTGDEDDYLLEGRVYV
jgi:hypothetical protein